MSHMIARSGVTIALAALLGAGLVPTAHAAPPDAPGGLSVQQPDAATAMLSWAPVSGANRYEVLVDDDPAFVTPYGGTTPVTTVNTTYVPTAALSASTNYWRVRAVNTGNERSGWSDSSFNTPRISTPQPASPIDNAVLYQPSDPPLLTWAASAGAQSYLVEVDGDDTLDTPQYSYTTKSTSLVVPDSLAVGDWFWRVTAVKSGGHASFPSLSRRFVIEPIKPPTAASPLGNAAVQDVVLDWDPEPGARTYEVQVATDDSFTQGDSLIDSVTGIVGTRYSRPISYDNASYFWRVRAIDVDGQATAWRTTSVGDQHTFTRNFPFIPQLVYPAVPGTETVGSPAYFQWTPVKHASEYELQVGRDPSFSPATSNTCVTAGTTYTGGSFSLNRITGTSNTMRVNEDCTPQAGVVNYWRVRPLDSPFTKAGASVEGVQGTFSATQAFLYEPLSISAMTPAGGATVDIPTLRWSPVVGAERFEIKIFRGDNTEVKSATTYANSYTPAGMTTLPASGNPYTWTVRAVSAKGASSVTYGNEFNVSGNPFATTAVPALTPLSPTSGNTGLKSVPQLTWEPMASAAYYRVSVGSAMNSEPQIWFGSTGTDLFDQPIAYPTMTDTSRRLLTGETYDWRVRAYNAAGAVIGVGPEGRFTVQPLGGITGHSVAIDGAELTDASGTPCTASTGTCTVPATPVLGWDPDPGVSFYMVYVSRDPLFTNLLEPDTDIPSTTNVMYAPTLDNRAHTYDDREAGNAYYWHIRPCRAVNICGPDPVSADAAQASFLKRSPSPKGLSPATGSAPLTSTEVTFAWNDYLEDNQVFTWPQTGEKSPQAAQKYRVQIDDDISFGSTLVDERVVDQTTYTSPDKLYANGTYFWRVQAIDSDENGLAWSSTQTFETKSPPVSVVSPTGAQTVSDAPTFRWNAQAFASSYDIEVYREADATHSPANLVFSKTGLKTTAYTHTNPLAALSATDKSYIWRIRRTDAKNNKGTWTTDILFRVTGSATEITSPAAGGSQPATAPVVTWNPVPGAATYDVTFRALSGGTNIETASTSALAFAATKRFATGSYEVTVRARDAAGGSIGASSLDVLRELRAFRDRGDGDPRTERHRRRPDADEHAAHVEPAGRGHHVPVVARRAADRRRDRHGVCADHVRPQQGHLAASDRHQAQLRQRGVDQQCDRRHRGWGAPAEYPAEHHGHSPGGRLCPGRTRHLVAAVADVHVPVAARRCSDPRRDRRLLRDQARRRRQGPLGHRPRQQGRVQRRRLFGGVGPGAEDEVDDDVDLVDHPDQEGQDRQGRGHRDRALRPCSLRTGQDPGRREDAQDLHPRPVPQGRADREDLHQKTEARSTQDQARLPGQRLDRDVKGEGHPADRLPLIHNAVPGRGGR